MPVSVSTFTRARFGTCTVRSIRSRRSRTVISPPEILTSAGSTGVPVEVAWRLALLFSSSEVTTETRPLRFLMVRRLFPPLVNSFSYDCDCDCACAREPDRQGKKETSRQAAIKREICPEIWRRIRGRVNDLPNIALDLAFR